MLSGLQLTLGGGELLDELVTLLGQGGVLFSQGAGVSRCLLGCFERGLQLGDALGQLAFFGDGF